MKKLRAITVTLKASQKFGDKYLVFYNGSIVHLPGNTFVFPMSDMSPEDVLKEIPTSLNLEQVSYIKIDF